GGSRRARAERSDRTSRATRSRAAPVLVRPPRERDRDGPAAGTDAARLATRTDVGRGLPQGVGRVAHGPLARDVRHAVGAAARRAVGTRARDRRRELRRNAARAASGGVALVRGVDGGGILRAIGLTTTGRPSSLFGGWRVIRS